MLHDVEVQHPELWGPCDHGNDEGTVHRSRRSSARREDSGKCANTSQVLALLRRTTKIPLTLSEPIPRLNVCMRAHASRMQQISSDKIWQTDLCDRYFD